MTTTLPPAQDDEEMQCELVKLSLCLTKHYAMKTCGGVDVGIHVL
jgi:hypothetical protein